MKYCIAQGADEFNWHQFLTEITFINRRGLLMEAAVNRAQNWVTCAVGNQCARIPRGELGEPLDRILVRSGREFFIAVRGMRDTKDPNEGSFNEYRDYSIQLLNVIEHRSSELLNKESVPV